MERFDNFNENELVYAQRMSNKEFFDRVKTIGIPLGLLLLTFFTTNQFQIFGSKVIRPMTATMWLVGLIVGFALPSHRRGTINETYGFILTYQMTLLIQRFVLGAASGVSPQMITSSFSQIVPTASTNALPGWILTMMMMTAFMLPLGFIGMQIKKLVQFRRTKNINKTLEELRGRADAGRFHY